jgi:hypothetical protein
MAIRGIGEQLSGERDWCVGAGGNEARGEESGKSLCENVDCAPYA